MKRLLWLLVLVFLVANLFILISGRTYLYKGIKETYLSGKSGPGIYDSLTFPTREAVASTKPKPWTKHKNIELTGEEVQSLQDIKTTSFLIIENGEIVLERYFDSHTKSTKSNSFSAAKSFIGLSIGIAVDKGFISSLDDTITNYLPFELKGSENITIRHLLSMSSDLKWSESGANPLSDNAWAYYGSDLSEVLKSVSFGDSPGSSFEYASGNSQLLGFILEKASGLSPTEFIEKYVWSKLNTTNDLMWSLDKENGMEKAFCCIYATSRDYARFGQLILNKGRWEDNLIISNDMLDELSAPYNESTPQYGLHFWLLDDPDHPAVYARGILGQYIIAIPSLNMVIVRTGHERQGKHPYQKNDYKSLHPKDLFTYISIAKRISKQN
jgi:CubicO group peptidase (beta-lactamase class C family)